VPSLSQVLRGLPEGQPVTLGELLDQLGSRVHGTALLILALPEALPTPVPSMSAILGVPLVLISAHLAIFGEKAGIPAALRRRQVPQRLLATLRVRVAPMVEWLEGISRPRWPWLAGQDRALGLIFLYLSILLLAPLPFINGPLAFCIVLLAWGMIQLDGKVVAAAIAATVGVTLGLLWIGTSLWSYVTGIWT